jgi:predicted nucleic acid-binding protein
MPEVYVLDSSALLTYLNKERGWQSVAKLLTRMLSDEADVLLHHIHLGEIYYVFYRRAGKARAEEVLADVQHIGIKLQDRVPLALVREAGRIKASYQLSYADALVVGLARWRGARLVSCDRRELEPLEAAGEVAMLWVR